MKPYVFAGPTLSHETVAQYLPDAVILPPAKAGDLRQVLERDCGMIGLIDGFFEQVPTVWHKEILFALSRGVWVYGAASMGALRAAELHQYGMVGIGAVFEAYASGEIEDDDEVAVSHAAADHDFRCLSDAMVNIRFGLAQAARDGAISDRARDALTASAKRLYYPDRSWKGLLRDAQETVDRVELSNLASWIQQQNPNQKRDDALALLTRMGQDCRKPVGLFAPAFTFEPTVFWDRFDLTFGSGDPAGKDRS